MDLPNLEIVIASTVEEIGTQTTEMLQALSSDATVAVSGGATYRAMFKVWRETLGSRRANIFPVDERVVPFESPDSNWGAATRLLLDPLDWPTSRRCFIRSMSALAAEEYENLLRSVFRSAMPRFDLVFLGVGHDGHTASLFPGSKALDDLDSWVLSTECPGPLKERITLGLGPICGARHVIVIATGNDKRPVVEQMLKGDETLPIVKVLTHQVKKTLFLDREAAGGLPGIE